MATCDTGIFQASQLIFLFAQAVAGSSESAAHCQSGVRWPLHAAESREGSHWQFRFAFKAFSSYCHSEGNRTTNIRAQSSLSLPCRKQFSPGGVPVPYKCHCTVGPHQMQMGLWLPHSACYWVLNFNCYCRNSVLVLPAVQFCLCRRYTFRPFVSLSAVTGLCKLWIPFLCMVKHDFLSLSIKGGSVLI